MSAGSKLSDEEIQKIKKHYALGKSMREITRLFGFHRTTILRYVEKRKYTPKNSKEKKADAVKAVQKRRLKIKLQSIEYKGGKCIKCGYNKCQGALEFHHIDPTTKSFGISSKGHCNSWDRVKEELDKCILICANCHRELHANLNKG